MAVGGAYQVTNAAYEGSQNYAYQGQIAIEAYQTVDGAYEGVGLFVYQDVDVQGAAAGISFFTALTEWDEDAAVNPNELVAAREFIRLTQVVES